MEQLGRVGYPAGIDRDGAGDLGGAVIPGSSPIVRLS